MMSQIDSKNSAKSLFWVLLVIVLVCALFNPPTPRVHAIARQGDNSGCALNDFQLLGQKWDANDSTGGTTTDSIIATDNGGLVSQGDMGVQIAGGYSKRVLLLIIDDFASTPNGRSHGDYVLEIATSAYIYSMTSSSLVIGIVDYGIHNTADSITTRTNQVIEGYGGTSVFDTIVLNMSFVFLPCEFDIAVGVEEVSVVVSDYLVVAREAAFGEEAVYLSLIDHILIQAGAAIGDTNLRQEVRVELGNIINSVSNDQNPMRSWLDGIVDTSEGHLVPVAAAGNFGLDFPFAPGSWESVISVGGSTGDDPITPKWSVAQNGEIMAPAAWFQVNSDEYISGTSFATPIASVLASLLASTSSSCDFVPLMDQAFDDEYYLDALSNACQP